MPPVIARLVERNFGKPIIRNDLRGELVEEIVALALEPEWQRCGDDWGHCDLKRASDGLRAQVKQSAALQSWSRASGPDPRPRYSIASKIGRWEGAAWVPKPGRNADIFIFAWHGRTDESADHREPDQWQFFIVPEHRLPVQKSIGWAALNRLAQPVAHATLQSAVERIADELTADGANPINPV